MMLVLRSDMGAIPECIHTIQFAYIQMESRVTLLDSELKESQTRERSMRAKMSQVCLCIHTCTYICRWSRRLARGACVPRCLRYAYVYTHVHTYVDGVADSREELACPDVSGMHMYTHMYVYM
jgi:hypothetical protein